MVTLDDATGELYSAILVEEEGTASSFLGLAETIAKKGLFRSLYTDRGSHYFYTPKAGGRVDKGQLTQVGRALKQLGITHIPSYSPEARGRMERVFGTLQKRLPQELGLAEITTTAAANRYLKEQFVPDYNARFAVPAAEPGSAFIALCRPAARGRAVHPGGPPGRPRQLRALERPVLADPAATPPPPLRQGDRARARISRRPARHLRRAGCLARFDPKEGRSMPHRPLNSARRVQPVDLWTTRRVAHNPTGPATAAADI